MVNEEELRFFRSLPRRLHHGEASCLAIAWRRNWAFLTDDGLARKTARTWGILVSGTLGLLIQAVKHGLLTAEEGDGLLGEMITRGYRTPHKTLQWFLENG